MGHKISTIIDEKVWAEVGKLAEESRQKISVIIEEALKDYLSKKRVRPEFVKHLDDSMNENQKLGELLAK